MMTCQAETAEEVINILSYIKTVRAGNSLALFSDKALNCYLESDDSNKI